MQTQTEIRNSSKSQNSKAKENKMINQEQAATPATNLETSVVARKPPKKHATLIVIHLSAHMLKVIGYMLVEKIQQVLGMRHEGVLEELLEGIDHTEEFEDERRERLAERYEEEGHEGKHLSGNESLAYIVEKECPKCKQPVRITTQKKIGSCPNMVQLPQGGSRMCGATLNWEVGRDYRAMKVFSWREFVYVLASLGFSWGSFNYSRLDDGGIKFYLPMEYTRKGSLWIEHEELRYFVEILMGLPGYIHFHENKKPWGEDGQLRKHWAFDVIPRPIKKRRIAKSHGDLADFFSGTASLNHLPKFCVSCNREHPAWAKQCSGCGVHFLPPMKRFALPEESVAIYSDFYRGLHELCEQTQAVFASEYFWMANGKFVDSGFEVSDGEALEKYHWGPSELRKTVSEWGSSHKKSFWRFLEKSPGEREWAYVKENEEPFYRCPHCNKENTDRYLDSHPAGYLQGEFVEECWSCGKPLARWDADPDFDQFAKEVMGNCQHCGHEVKGPHSHCPRCTLRLGWDLLPEGAEEELVSRDAFENSWHCCPNPRCDAEFFGIAQECPSCKSGIQWDIEVVDERYMYGEYSSRVPVHSATYLEQIGQLEAYECASCGGYYSGRLSHCPFEDCGAEQNHQDSEVEPEAVQEKPETNLADLLAEFGKKVMGEPEKDPTPATSFGDLLSGFNPFPVYQPEDEEEFEWRCTECSSLVPPLAPQCHVCKEYLSWGYTEYRQCEDCGTIYLSQDETHCPGCGISNLEHDSWEDEEWFEVSSHPSGGRRTSRGRTEPKPRNRDEKLIQQFIDAHPEVFLQKCPAGCGARLELTAEECDCGAVVELCECGNAFVGEVTDQCFFCGEIYNHPALNGWEDQIPAEFSQVSYEEVRLTDPFAWEAELDNSFGSVTAPGDYQAPEFSDCFDFHPPQLQEVAWHIMDDAPISQFSLHPEAYFEIPTFEEAVDELADQLCEYLRREDEDDS